MKRWLACGAISLALHAGLLTAAGWGGRFTPPAAEVTGGPTSVALVVYAPERVSAIEPSRPGIAQIPEPALPRPPRAAGASVRLDGAEQATPRYARNPPPPYPWEAFVHRQQGRVDLLVEVDAQGRARRVTVERSSGSAFLDAAARTAVLGWEFTPARQGARPIASVCRIPIHFRLEEDR